jgi:hypothetical protein
MGSSERTFRIGENERPPFNYFITNPLAMSRVIDTQPVIPAGFTTISSGILEYTQSDDLFL